MRTDQLLTCLGVLSLFWAFNSAPAQGTAFVYQGCLKESGVPAGGQYDFRFRLAADPLGNQTVGTPFLARDISVTGGLFTATLDFGPGIFTGRNYWLEVAVRTNGASTDFTVLSPLQAVAPTPYAIFAGAASNLSGTVGLAQIPAVVVTNGANSVNLSGVFSGDGRALTGVALLVGGNSFSGDQIFTEGNVGVGTTTPQNKLDVRGTVMASGFSGDGAGLTNIFSPTTGDYLFAYADSGVQSNGTFMAFKYVIGPSSNITFNSCGPSSDWTPASSGAGQVFVAAHTGVYWVQYTVCDTYAQGGGFPHFQATLNGKRIPGGQCTPIGQGHATTSFIATVNAADKLGIQCTPYAAQTLGTWNAGYFASLNILRIR